MSEPIPVPISRGEKAACLMPITEVDWDEDAGLFRGETRACGAELWVVWSFAVPYFDTDEVVRPEDVQCSAYTSSWHMECSGGHVMAESSNCYTTLDHAEPFDPRMVTP